MKAWLALRIRNLSNLAFSPDCNLLTLEVREPPKGESANSHIWALRLPGGEPRQWTSSPKNETNSQWSPDSIFLALLSNRDEGRQIYLIPANGGGATGA